MWAARDKDGYLELYTNKPQRVGNDWFCTEPTMDSSMAIEKTLFPNLKWEDEPIEVELFPVNYKDYLVKINKD